MLNFDKESKAKFPCSIFDFFNGTDLRLVKKFVEATPSKTFRNEIEVRCCELNKKMSRHRDCKLMEFYGKM